AENYRIVAAPTVRVAMSVFVVAKKSAAISEQFHDDGIRGENVFAFVFWQAFEVDALVVEGRIDFQSIFLAGIKVIRAVTWSGVNDATALIERNVIGENAGHVNGEKGELKFHAVEIAALERGAYFGVLDPAFGLMCLKHIGSDK